MTNGRYIKHIFYSLKAFANTFVTRFKEEKSTVRPCPIKLCDTQETHKRHKNHFTNAIFG